jgi:hypothetical protein
MDRKINPQIPIIFLFSLFVFWGFGYQTVWPFLNLELEGVVISTKDIPSTGAPRYVTDYIFRSSNGQNHTYVAGPTDASLPRSMPVGTQIKKQSWNLYYERNGEWYSFPFVFYSIVLTAALGCVVYALLGTFRFLRLIQRSG